MANQKKFNKNLRPPLKQESDNYSIFFLPSILIITAIVFGNTLGNNFIDNWDDNFYILKNEIIKHLNWENLKVIFSTFYTGNYHPLTILSYSIEYKLFGLNPFPFHLTNYILHLLNVLLVYLFMKRFTGKLYVAVITSLFFAIHPMHVESVAWISERKDVLYTFFFLLSLNSYSKYLTTEKKISYIVWTFVWFFLSLLSKPAGVCMPLVLMLMDFYHHKKLSWRMLTSKIHFFALALLFGIVAIFAQRSAGYISDPSLLLSIPDRVFLACYSTVYYLFKVFVPFNLSALHYYPVKSGSMLPIEYYLTLPVLLLLVWGVFKSGRFKYELIFGLLFYFITIVLALQIIPVGMAIVSERYSYIPYIGIFFIIGQIFSYVKDNILLFNNKIKYIVFFALIFLTVLYSFLTYERNKVWKNGIILFTDVIDKYPEQGYGFWNRGNSENEKKDYNAALLDFNKAIELNPKLVEAYFNRGSLYNKIGNFSSAVADFNVTLHLNPNYPWAVYSRGLSFMNLNQMDKSLRDFNKAIELNPKYAKAYFNRGNAYDKLNNYKNAVSDYTKGLEIEPNDNTAYYFRGLSKASLKDFTGAIADYGKALELKPNVPEIYMNRAIAKFNLNDKKGACNDWLSAQQLGITQATTELEQYCK